MDEFDITPDEGYPYIGMTYEIPDISLIRIPDNVVGKSGYELPFAKTQDVDDATADEIISNLGTGPTGDELSFDSQFYPYYYMLNDEGKRLYRQVVANTNAQNNAFTPVGDYSVSDVKKVMEAVFNDHPELFWLNTAYNCKCRGGNNVVELDLYFNQTVDDFENSLNAFNQSADSIIEQARNLPNAFEQEKYVHDALSNMNDYKLSAPMNQSAYSAIVNGQTVCAGYARAMQYIMQRLGVPCYYCAGYAGENHAWDIVRLDGDFYNVDVTWDDADPINYDYFNKSDKNYASTHARRSMSINLPACNGTNYQVDSTLEAVERDDEVYDDSMLEGDDGYSDFVAPDSEYDLDTNSSDYDSIETDGLYNDDLPSENELYSMNVPGTGGSVEANAMAQDSNAKRSIADIGVSEADVLNSIDEYFNDCKQQIVSNGKGAYSFTNVINGDSVYAQWEQAYNTDEYKDAYLRSALSEIGASGCQISLSAEALQDGKYLITHKFDMK